MPCTKGGGEGGLYMKMQGTIYGLRSVQRLPHYRLAKWSDINNNNI